MRRRRVFLAAGLLLAVGVAGCIGFETGPATESPSTDAAQQTSGCNTQGGNNQISPGAPLVIEGHADGSPAMATVEGTSTGSGTLTITIEHDGEEVFSEGREGLGSVGQEDAFDARVEDLGAGDHTFTVSTEDGYREVSLQFTITWGTGSCP